MPRIETILHPTDFSENARPAFELACSLARDYQASLVVLHVMIPSSSPLMTTPPPDPRRPAESQATSANLPWPPPSDPRIRVEHRLAEGDPAEEVLRLAEAMPCDLIVMGTHGKTGLSRLLTGSVAEQVLRNAVCPVLVVKAPLGTAPGAGAPFRRLLGVPRCTTMLEKMISGGQTGANQAAWRAARAFGVSTGGWMPQAFLTEDGPRPEFVERYAAVELPASSTPPWVDQNVQDSDGTLWFGATATGDAQATVAACLKRGKPCLPISPEAAFEPRQVAAWIAENQVRVLNVAGNREVEEPGIGDRVERFLGQVLQQLGHERAREEPPCIPPS